LALAVRPWTGASASRDGDLLYRSNKQMCLPIVFIASASGFLPMARTSSRPPQKAALGRDYQFAAAPGSRHPL
jgi:hypothetical protein